MIRSFVALESLDHSFLATCPVPFVSRDENEPTVDVVGLLTEFGVAALSARIRVRLGHVYEDHDAWLFNAAGRELLGDPCELAAAEYASLHSNPGLPIPTAEGTNVARFGAFIPGDLWSSTILFQALEEQRLRLHLSHVMLLFHWLLPSAVRRSTRPVQPFPRRQLTARETQCIALAARGMTSADIGAKLGITERTANFHFTNAMTKLEALNRQEVIATAIRLRLVDL